ncbi:MAG TPA: VCBS repeat-containing protein, partial [Polyangiaceae bacterium]|nr:VCBS repeat-containing protein [Polyangiaceae bacterium]
MVVVTVRGAALALAATGVLVGCGRSELEPGPVDTGGASAFAEGGRTGAGAGGGTGGAPSGAGADSGANGGGRGGSGGGTDGGGAGFAGRGAGLAGSSGDTGGAGGSLAGGGMGATDDLPVVCQPSLTPAFDGPPGTLTFASADSGVLFDFNHDGKLDLVTGDRGGNVSVYLGLGDGSLADRVTYLTGLNQTGAPDLDVPCLVTAGDLDLDGNLDLIASSSAGASISVLLGRRDGTFSPPTNYGTGDDMPVVATAVGDLNGDGWPDVMVAKTDGIEPSAVNMLVGTGDGSLGVTVGIQNGGTVRGIALGDFNGDKRLDAALLEQSVVTVLVAVGGGLFESLGDLELQGSTPASLEVDDLNGDENLDLIATMECDRVADPTQVSVFLGTGAGTFRPDASYHASICGGGKAALGDLNRDGSPDVATSADTALLGRGDGTFAPEVASSQTVGGTLLGLGDFDGDGIPDEATSAAGIGGSEWILVRHGNGDGTFGPIHDFATASGAWALVLADFDHDGALDVAALNGQTDDAVSVLLGDGKGGLSAPANYGTSAYPRALGLLIDRTDQAALVTTNDIPSVDVLTGDGHGKFAAPSEFMVGPGPTAPLIGDLDGNLWP